MPGTVVDVFNATTGLTGALTCASATAGGAAVDTECEDFQQACAPEVIPSRCNIEAPGGRAALAVVSSQF